MSAARKLSPVLSSRRFVAVAGALLLAAIVFARAATNGEADVLWGTRAGLDMLANGHLPRVEQYSWTAAGRPWIPNSWLWDLVLGVAYRLVGPVSWCLLDAAAVAVIAGMLFRRCQRAGAGALSILIVAGLTGVFSLFVWMTPRAQLTDYVILPALLALTRSSLTAAGRRWLLHLGATLVLEVIWVNFHFSAVLAPPLAAAAALGLVLEAGAGERCRVAARGALLVMVLAGACCLTPYGAAAAGKALLVRNDSAGLIVEWLPPGFGNYAQATAVVALVVATGSAVVAWRSRDWSQLAVLLALACVTATACRFAPMLDLVAVPGAALGVHSLMKRFPATAAGARSVACLFVGCVLLLFAPRALAPSLLTPGVSAPSLARLIPSGCKVVTDYDIGGYLELYRPDVSVSIDGRNDVYGRSGVAQNTGLLEAKPDQVARMERAGANCALIDADAPLARLLTSDPSWTVAGTDRGRMLLVRMGTPSTSRAAR